MNTDTITQSHIDTYDEDPLADLQSLWDEQSRRIDHLLAVHPEARPVRLNLRHSRPWRRRIMAEYLVLALLNIAAGIYSLFALLPDPYILIRITGIVIVSTNAILAVHSLYCYFVILRHHPARVSIARMSRFISRMHGEPHYAPDPDSRKSHIIHVDFRNAVATAITSARQVAAVSVVALMVLTAVSCTPIGDGYAMTKADRDMRAIVVKNIDFMIAQI